MEARRGAPMKKFAPLLALLLLAQPARAQSGPTEFSGMASFGDRDLLVVSDAKADSPAPRVGLLNLAWKRPVVQGVVVDDWKGDPASDLEACCPVPGTTDEFYLAESGWWKGRFGRVFRMKVTHDPARGWVGTVLSSFQPFPAPADGETPSPLQIEGIGAFQDVVVLGLRGGKGQPGRLVWGRPTADGFQKEGEQEFSLDAIVPGGRSCGDLLLVPDFGQRGSWGVYSVAATDPGDLGPFRSAVVRIGRIRRSSFQAVPPAVVWRLDGLKVEALAPTPEGIEGSGFCIGTDDENYGGIWRPLPSEVKP